MVAYEKGWLPEGRRADAHHRDQRVSFPLDVIRLSLSSFLFPFTHFLPLFLSLSLFSFFLSFSFACSFSFSLACTFSRFASLSRGCSRKLVHPLAPGDLTRFARDFM